MIGFAVVNPEVLIARELERGGRFAPGLDFIRWRLAELRRELDDDAEFWGIPSTDIAASRARQLAEARRGASGRSGAAQTAPTQVPDVIEKAEGGLRARESGGQ